MNLAKLLPLLFALLAPLCTRAATPTFSSFATNDFFLTTNGPPTNLQIIHIIPKSTGTISVTNLYVTNIVINGFGLVVTNGNPVLPPFHDPTLWINVTNLTQWVWDAGTSTWIQLNPSLNTGLYAVPSIVELRMIVDNGLLQWATTNGNLAPGDGQGRHYFWNALDTSADDGISVIKPDTTDPGDPGRWNEQ